ncbi:hypothetical protein H2200_010293 [Cladophialophora chaetospira]|uniref:Heterokaryon incompatibility domain-containing protein n=1 Tax=Cladophialophora chaetospira TaxID=386627 RepID=A0AA38X178_9EURO|nr:hypothetical protein H2200_010293 [Cladophialophora chaetospira]
MGPAALSVYNPLSIYPREIRLITLHPAADKEAPIQCELNQVELKSAPPYETLSYVWGPPSFTESIRLGSHDVHITPNLASALRQLRPVSPRPARVLWIDALCINQDDLAERSAQVLLMRDIYTRGKTNMAFLGTQPLVYDYFDSIRNTQRDWRYGKGDTEELRSNDVPPTHLSYYAQLADGLALTKRILGHDISTLRTIRDEGSRRLRKMYSNEDMRSSKLEKGLMVLTVAQQYLLERVFKDSALWKRVWIVQELSCAPHVVLFGGGEELEWDLLATFLGDRPYADAFHGTFGHQDDLCPLLKEIFVDVQRIQHQRKIVRSFSHPSALLDVLARFRDTEASDPRDKIYGLLGLVSERHGIIPDYSKSAQEVFIEVTAAHINMTETLDIICQNPFQPKFRRRVEDMRSITLPSWTADFSEKHPNALLFAQRGIFNASKTSCKVPCCVTDGKLSVTCVVLDKVGPRIQHHKKNHQFNLGFVELCRLNFNEADVTDPECVYAPMVHAHDAPEPPKEPALRAYTRTLLKDCIRAPQTRNRTLVSLNYVADDNSTAPPRLRRMTAEEISEAVEFHRDLLVNNQYYLDPPDDGSMFTKSSQGLYLMVQPSARPGDLVAILDGGKVPVILRPTVVDSTSGATAEHYRFVCVAYVHGFMDGEVTELLKAGKVIREKVVLE